MIVVCYRAHRRHVKSLVAQSGHIRLRSCHKLVAVGREFYFALAWTIGPLTSSDLTAWRVLYQESMSQVTWLANVFVAQASTSPISGPFCDCFTTSLLRNVVVAPDAVDALHRTPCLADDVPFSSASGSQISGPSCLHCLVHIASQGQRVPDQRARLM